MPTIRLRRDTYTNWYNNNPILELGEPSYDVTNKRIKVGDGITPWRTLSYLVDTTIVGNGYTGSRGATGPLGFTGSKGAGFTGSKGYVGSAGTNGINGFTGSRGAEGAPGASSALGYTGSKGDPNGYTGSAGVGVVGYTGSSAPGYTGSAGAGYTGSASTAAGYTGSAGTGYVGSAGVGGSNTQIQYNNSGTFAGSPTLVFNGTNSLALGVGYTGSDGTNLTIQSSTSAKLTVSSSVNSIAVMPSIILEKTNTTQSNGLQQAGEIAWQRTLPDSTVWKHSSILAASNSRSTTFARSAALYYDSPAHQFRVSGVGTLSISNGSVGVSGALGVEGVTNSAGLRITQLYNPPDAPTFTVSPTGGSLPAGTYYFKVVVVNGMFGTTVASPESLPAVTTGTTSTISISWAGNSGSDRYRVYYRQSTNSSYSSYITVYGSGTTSLVLSTFDGLDISSGGLPIFNTTGYVSIGSTLSNNYKLDIGASSRSYGFVSSSLATPSYRDPPVYEVPSGGSLSTNTTFYFKIVAVDGLGGTSLPSIEISFIPTKSNSAALIRWSSVPGAVYYQIWFSAGPRGSQTQVLYLTSDTNEYTFTGTENPFGGVLPTKDTSGAIGIGTSYPSEKLDVTGNAKIRGNIYADKTVVMGTSFRRNRIINGDMKVNQRFVYGEIEKWTSAGSQAMIDRWNFNNVGFDTYRIKYGQNLDNIAPPPGFSNYLGIKNASPIYGIPAGGSASIYQWIEGYNIRDFDFGYDTTVSFTVSFWVYCNRSGSYSVRFVGGDSDVITGGSWVSYVTTFSIITPEISTWKKIIITVPGTAMRPAAGSWNTTNNRGLAIQISLGHSPTHTLITNNLNNWYVGNYAFASTQTGTLFESQNGIFCITGVQLEPGTEATPYEYVSYSEQLAQCQRYFEIVGASMYTSYIVYGVPAITSSTFKVEKRATPYVSTIYTTLPTGNYTRWNLATAIDKTYMTFGYTLLSGRDVTTFQGSVWADSEML